MSDTLVILLHGVGSSGANLAGLGEHWRGIMPDASFAAPDGPEPFDQGGAGRQWFSVRGVTPANRAERIVAARSAFDATLRSIVARHGFAERLGQVALVGFSQGSIMALDAIVSGRWPVGAVVAFSGRLASPEPFAPVLSARVCMIHGSADPVMPLTEMHDAEQRLRRAGLSVEAHVMDGLGHTISERGAAIGGSFLAKGPADRSGG